MVAQEQAIRNNIKANIDKTQEKSKCVENSRV